MDIERVNRWFGSVPLNEALGLRATGVDGVSATAELPYREDLVGNTETGFLHGGAITTLIDATCGVAVFAAMPTPRRIATLDLRIDYLKPATAGQTVICRAECFKVTRRVAFVRALAHHGDPDHAVASAAGTFMIFDDTRSAAIAEAPGSA